MKPIYVANAVLLAVVAALSYYVITDKPDVEPPPIVTIDEPAKKDLTEPAQSIDAKDGPMPRRLLGIAVSNYLYANPVSNGAKGAAAELDRDRHDIYKALERLADGWRIPKDQRYFVSDGPLEDGHVHYRRPPLKMIIEGTISLFLETCRPQDRIVIVFAGHAIEKDGAAYLVPIEGEFDDLASLIPLKDFYAKLGKCPAQEKLVIFDVCRSFPGRSIERPAFGKMTEALEKALHECPDGATIWTTCSAGQCSYEDDYAQLELVGLGKPIISGSYFFSMFFPASAKKIFNQRDSGGGDHAPADPLPIGPTSKFLNEETDAVAMELQKQHQTPKVTSKAPKEWLPYDPTESPAKPSICPCHPPRPGLARSPPFSGNSISRPSRDCSLRCLVKRRSTISPCLRPSLKNTATITRLLRKSPKPPAKFTQSFPIRARRGRSNRRHAADQE